MEKVIERFRQEKEDALPAWFEKGCWAAKRWVSQSRFSEVKRWAVKASELLPEWDGYFEPPDLPEDIYEEWKADRREQPEIVPDGDDETLEYARGFFVTLDEMWEAIESKL